ncbi:MAG: hypothetical protein KJZ75_11180 [Hyphomonadaceae bacterium]|nr:hypothetical protein [Hyphomonadaceae bacterium]
MSLATLHPNLRAAFRQKLLTLIDIDHSPGVSVSLASGVFTRASGSWLDAGFARGMEVQAIGFTNNPRGVVTAVSALALTTTIAAPASQTVGGGGQFVVGLPIGRAWEGETGFFPSDDAPYVAETVLPGPSRKTSVGGPNGRGAVIEHKPSLVASFFYPKGRGTIAIERMTGAAMTAFLPGSALSYGADSARITDVQCSQNYDDGSRIGRAVTVSLLAFTQN